MFKEKYCIEVAMKIYSTGIIAHEEYGNAVNVFWASDDYSVYFVCLKRGHFVKENGHFLLIFLLGWYILF